MATQYPNTYPPPQLNAFSMLVQMGAARSDISGHQSQRRIFQTMPHTFSLSFVISVADWTLWQQWVKLNAYSWFEMKLPNLYASQDGLLVGPTLIRFISPMSASNITPTHVQVSVQAEMAPSAISQYLEVA